MSSLIPHTWTIYHPKFDKPLVMEGLWTQNVMRQHAWRHIYNNHGGKHWDYDDIIQLDMVDNGPIGLSRLTELSIKEDTCRGCGGHMGKGSLWPNHLNCLTKLIKEDKESTS